MKRGLNLQMKERPQLNLHESDTGDRRRQNGAEMWKSDLILATVCQKLSAALIGHFNSTSHIWDNAFMVNEANVPWE